MDLWVSLRLLAKNKSGLLNVLLWILIFAAGWRLGLVTSPYYASSPIVFENVDLKNAAQDYGPLNELKQAGIAQRENDEKRTQVAGTIEPGPAVESGQAAAADASASQSRGLYVGSVNSDKYHDLNCSSWKRINESNQIWFASREEAESHGYTPTKCTSELQN